MIFKHSLSPDSIIVDLIKENADISYDDYA